MAVATAAFVVAVAILVRATMRRVMRARWWLPLLVAMATGAVFAWCGRAVTTGGIDSNIGASVGIVLAVVAGLPLVVLTIVLGTWASAAGPGSPESAAQADGAEPEGPQPM